MNELQTSYSIEPYSDIPQTTVKQPSNNPYDLRDG